MARTGIRVLLSYRRYNYPRWRLYTGIPEFSVSPVVYKLIYENVSITLYENHTINLSYKNKCIRFTKSRTWMYDSDRVGKQYIWAQIEHDRIDVKDRGKNVDKLMLIDKLEPIQIKCYDDLYRYLLVLIDIDL